MSLTHEDVVKIMKIVDECEYDEFHLETGDLKLHLRKSAGGVDQYAQEQADGARSPSPAADAPRTTAPAAAPAKAAAVPAEEAVGEGLVAVRAPMLGTFYRAPSPAEPPFVEPGDKVEADATVCLVEVMKLFQSVKAGVAGTVKKILVENGSMVEYGQILILIDPEADAARK